DHPSGLVLHWGVNEAFTGGWQTPPTDLWPPGTVLHSDGVAARTPMTEAADGIWSVSLPTDTTIVSIHFVVNTGTPSNPGPEWGHSLGGANWNVYFLDARITAVLVAPVLTVQFEDPLRSPYFLNPGDSVEIVLTAVTHNSRADSLELWQGNIRVAATGADTLRYPFHATAGSAGPQHWLGVASDTAGYRDSVAFVFMVNPPVTEAPPPAGVRPGINYTGVQSVILALYAPRKDFVYVIGDFNDWKVDTTYFMHRYQPRADSTLWWVEVSGLSVATQYAFQYLVDGTLRIADPYSELILDPWNDGYISNQTFPDLKPYPHGKTRYPVGVLQTAQTPFQWVYSDTFRPPAVEDLIIYELHVRDFLQLHDYTTLRDTLDYLDRLGINAIELMPINEFEGNSSWGYNPDFYFAPDKYYGTAHTLKRFIDECHRRGIAVIQDLVLNHSYGLSPLVQLYWDDTNNRPAADNPWYNVQSPNPVFAWGYDFNHESPDTRYFVDRVLAHWVTDFQVDGFRFDFSKGFTNTPGDGWAYDASRIANLERIADRIWSLDSSAILILEHFTENAEETVLANYGFLLWGNLNYAYNEATMGWVGDSDFSWGYYGTRGWTVPHLVTYMESHDEERLMYKNLQYGNGNGEYQIRELSTALNRMKLAGAFFFTLPGPKMIWQFGELGYDVSIDVPCRVCEKPIRWNYYQDEDRRKLYQTWQALLRLRHREPLFSSGDTEVDTWLNSSTGKKRLRLSRGEDHAVIVGNFAVFSQSINPQFYGPGIWYDYFSGDSLIVTDVNATIPLAPGEFHLYTDFRTERPTPGLLAVDPTDTPLPTDWILLPNVPNPFNPATTIRYSLPRTGRANLTVYDLQGREVITLVNRVQSPGWHTLSWDGKDASGRPVSSGVYLYRLQSAGKQQTRKMIYLR
ncbi:MAG: T9SS C-terminal target domain-containing protein, partial [Candidatus Neomarinimicrobiota bacterium]